MSSYKNSDEHDQTRVLQRLQDQILRDQRPERLGSDKAASLYIVNLVLYHAPIIEELSACPREKTGSQRSSL